MSTRIVLVMLAGLMAGSGSVGQTTSGTDKAFGHFSVGRIK